MLKAVMQAPSESDEETIEEFNRVVETAIKEYSDSLTSAHSLSSAAAPEQEPIQVHSYDVLTQFTKLCDLPHPGAYKEKIIIQDFAILIIADDLTSCVIMRHLDLNTSPGMRKNQQNIEIFYFSPVAETFGFLSSAQDATLAYHITEKELSYRNLQNFIKNIVLHRFKVKPKTVFLKKIQLSEPREIKSI